MSVARARVTVAGPRREHQQQPGVGPGTHRVALGLNKKVRRRLHKGSKLTFELTATDTAGNSAGVGGKTLKLR